jgi:hypothetical protein
MNNDNENEIESIIIQLKSLQLQQTELLVRLERARSTETGTGAADSGTRTSAIETRGSIAQPKDFGIGDRVRIKNPNRFQTDRGTITNIGAKRITVQTRSGTKILRAPKNLTIDDE